MLDFTNLVTFEKPTTTSSTADIRPSPVCRECGGGDGERRGGGDGERCGEDSERCGGDGERCGGGEGERCGGDGERCGGDSEIQMNKVIDRHR